MALQSASLKSAQSASGAHSLAGIQPLSHLKGLVPDDSKTQLGFSPTDTMSKAAPAAGAQSSSVVVAALPSDMKVAQKSLVLGAATIPLIDLADIAKAKGAERRTLIDNFGDKLKEVGFIAIKAADLTPLIKEVNAEMASYFHQSPEKKHADWHNNNSQTGFSSQGTETAAGAKKADLKETYFIPPAFANWPKDRPKFEKVMGEFHTKLTDIAAQVMAYFAEYINEPTEAIAKSMSAAHNLLRLAYYPAPKPSDDHEAVWAAAHEDLNAFTLLPPSTVPGLQLLTKEGKWIPVTVPEGYLIVNTGEQLQYWTAGLIQATRHQVLNPGGEYSRQERFSTPFFASWSSGFSLKPPKSCMDKMTENMSPVEKLAYQKLFPDVTVWDNLESRLIEMGTIKVFTEDRVRQLRAMGLLRKPPQTLVATYPAIFKA